MDTAGFLSKHIKDIINIGLDMGKALHTTAITATTRGLVNTTNYGQSSSEDQRWKWRQASVALTSDLSGIYGTTNNNKRLKTNSNQQNLSHA